ncbi:hypothetical protein BDQ12DRAFT_714750, partial [Crucibulum laeve]
MANIFQDASGVSVINSNLNAISRDQVNIYLPPLRALEQVEIDTLVQSLAAKLHQKGMSEAEISTQVYSQPWDAAQIVSTLLTAKNTPSARDDLPGIQASQSVPQQEFIPRPKYPIAITLKNLGDFYIQYSYSEDGIEKQGILLPNQIGPTPTMFLMNKTYLFTLKKPGRKVESTSRTFTKQEDWDLAVHFKFIPIILKNLGDFYIQYSYSEDGIEKQGILNPNQIGPTPTMFLVNNTYSFTLKKPGRIIDLISRTFTKEEDWDLAVYFKFIPITLKNSGKFFIQFSYSEDGIKKHGMLLPNQIGPTPTMFLMNNTYLFTLKKGRKVESISRTFT